MELVTTRFNEFAEASPGGNEEKQWLRIRPLHSEWDTGGPYPDAYVRVIETKELAEEERQQMLRLFSRDLAAENGSPKEGGSFVPTHGLRIYRGEELLHEGAFLWPGRCFTFIYPGPGSEHWWLKASPELEALCRKLLPLSEQEIRRMKEQPGLFALRSLFPRPEMPVPKSGSQTFDRGGATIVCPKEYRHRALEGIDTHVGEIEIPAMDLKVSYDIGTLAGEPPSYESLVEGRSGRVLHAERESYEGDWEGIDRFQLVCYRLGKDRVQLHMIYPTHWAFFRCYFEGEDRVEEVCDAVRKIFCR